MTDLKLSLLVSTAIATSALHMLIPDHWLPFVLIGRARSWSAKRTAFVSGISALVHTALSALLGLASLVVGLEASRAVGERIEVSSGVLLIVFGLVYAAWAWRKGGHFHPGGDRVHGAIDGHDHEGRAAERRGGRPYPADQDIIRGGPQRGEMALALIVGLNPCVLILPLVFATAGSGPVAVAGVLVAYCVTTVAIMVTMSVIGVLAARAIPVPPIAMQMETASGLLIAAAGIAFLWLSG